MSDMTRQSGWQNLSNGFDVELQHGIPVRLSNNGQDIPSDDAELVEEVSRLSGLTVVVSGWVEADEPGEQETRLCVDALQFEDVLQRPGGRIDELPPIKPYTAYSYRGAELDPFAPFFQQQEPQQAQAPTSGLRPDFDRNREELEAHPLDDQTDAGAHGLVIVYN